MVDEWGFPIADSGYGTDEWGYPVENPYAQQQMIEQQMMQQHMLELQQNSQYAQQELMYNAQVTQQKYMNALMKGKQVHYTNHEILNGLKSYVAGAFGGVVPREVIKIDDFPQTFRHACAYTKERITYLPLYYFSIPEIGTNIPFYFCRACGKLYYPSELIGYC